MCFSPMIVALNIKNNRNENNLRMTVCIYYSTSNSTLPCTQTFLFVFTTF